MSLINEALKRARQAQQKNTPSPVPVAPLRPAEAARPRSTGPGMWLPIVLAALLMLAFVVMWAMGRGGAGKNVAPGTMQEIRRSPGGSAKAPTRMPAAPQPQPDLAPATVAPADSPAGGTATSTPPPPATTTVPAIVAETPPAAPAWPKLQGIFYRSDRPSVLLNGKTVLIGERSGDFLVVAIDRQCVTLVHADVTNVMRLTE